MAIGIGQLIGTTSAASVASANATFSTAPAAGSMLAVLISCYNPTATDTHGIASVSDNKGNTYVRAIEKLQTSDTHVWSTIFYAKNIASSATFTVTVTGQAASGNYLTFGVVEVTGAHTTAPLDQTSTNQTASQSTMVATGVTTTVANEYVAGVASPTSGPGAYTAPTGYANRVSQTDDNTQQAGSADDKIRTTTGTETPSWGVSINAASTVVMATFKVAAAAAPLKRHAAELSGLGSPGPFFRDPLGGP